MITVTCQHKFTKAEAHGFVQQSANAEVNLFADYDWYVLLWRNIATEMCALQLFRVDSNAAPLLWLPMVQCRQPDYKPTTLQALSNYYSPLFYPLTNQPITPQLLRPIIQMITQQQCYDSIVVSPVAMDSDFTKVWGELLQQHGFFVLQQPALVNWYQTIGIGGYEEYWQQRPGRLRNTWQRKFRKITKDGNVFMQIYQLPDTALQQAIAEYNNIYALSWKQPEAYREFIPELIYLAAQRGWLRLGILYFNGVAIAAQLWLVAQGTASIYKLAYDPAFRNYSPGTLLTAHLMRHVIEVDRVVTVDFLTGDDSYKQDWMDNSRQRIAVIAYNRTTIWGNLLLLRYRLQQIKHWFMGKRWI